MTTNNAINISVSPDAKSFYVNGALGSDTAATGRGSFYLPYALPSAANAATTGQQEIVNIYPVLSGSGYSDPTFNLNNQTFYNGLNTGDYQNLSTISGGTIGLGTGWANASGAQLVVSTLYLVIVLMNLKVANVTSGELKFFNTAYTNCDIISLDLNTVLRYDKAFILNYLNLDGGTIYLNNITASSGSSITLGSNVSVNAQNSYVSNCTFDVLNFVASSTQTIRSYVKSSTIGTINADGANVIVYIDASSWPATINLSNGAQVLPLPQIAVNIEGGFIETAVITNGYIGAQQNLGKSSVAVSTTTKTLDLSDAGTLQNCSNGSTQTITVPPQTDVVWVADTEIDFAQTGVGKVTLAEGSGVTIVSAFGNLSIAVQYAGATLKRLGSDLWLLVGNLAP